MRFFCEESTYRGYILEIQKAIEWERPAQGDHKAYGRLGPVRKSGKQEFRRTDFDSRVLAAEGEGGGGQ